VCREARPAPDAGKRIFMPHNDNLLLPIKTNEENLGSVINLLQAFLQVPFLFL
jgi:hypothetical protein